MVLNLGETPKMIPRDYERLISQIKRINELEKENRRLKTEMARHRRAIEVLGGRTVLLRVSGVRMIEFFEAHDRIECEMCEKMVREYEASVYSMDEVAMRSSRKRRKPLEPQECPKCGSLSTQTEGGVDV